MKFLDILLILCSLCCLALGYFVAEPGLRLICNIFAVICGALVGAMIGGRIHKKNFDKENK